MNTRSGVVEEVKCISVLRGYGSEIRVRLMGEDENQWYPAYGPLPDVGDVVRVVLSVGDDEPYIDTAVR